MRKASRQLRTAFTMLEWLLVVGSMLRERAALEVNSMRTPQIHTNEGDVLRSRKGVLNCSFKLGDQCSKSVVGCWQRDWSKNSERNSNRLNALNGVTHDLKRISAAFSKARIIESLDFCFERVCGRRSQAAARRCNFISSLVGRGVAKGGRRASPCAYVADRNKHMLLYAS